MKTVTFARITRSHVIGTLKATGSNDPDVLFAAKEGLLETVRPLKFMGLWAYVTGGLATLLILLAFIGIPLIIFGWWVRRRAAENIETIEKTFAEHVASLDAGAVAAG
jgi:hypothetical protein